MKNFIAPNDEPSNLRGSPWEQSFDTMTSQDIDEIDLFVKKIPKKAQLLRNKN